MSYSVRIPPSVLEELRSSVPRAFWPHILDQLERLGLNPQLGRRLTEEWGPLAGRMVYPFRVDFPPGTRRFAVVYEFSQDERSIVIVQVIPPGDLRPAEEA